MQRVAQLVFQTNLREFELIIKLILSQPPLPIGLHAQMILNWYSRRDSNPHCTDLESVVSCQLDYASKGIADFGLRIWFLWPLRVIDDVTTSPASSIRNSNFAIRNLIWYRRRDSNPHCLVPKTSASSQLGYAGMVQLVR